uniref:Uncharacterized protein n=1 Tax=Knipowitschia caucasica TaxID=637954 RepID=A0AAV2J2N9_KNICA
MNKLVRRASSTLGCSLDSVEEVRDRRPLDSVEEVRDRRPLDSVEVREKRPLDSVEVRDRRPLDSGGVFICVRSLGHNRHHCRELNLATSDHPQTTLSPPSVHPQTTLSPPSVHPQTTLRPPSAHQVALWG